MNYTDTEKIRAIFESCGFEYEENLADADVIVLNTCSVRQRAEDKVLGLARQIVALKEDRPEVQVILTGCMAQRLIRKDCEEEIDPKYYNQLRDKMEWVDHIVEIDDSKVLKEIIDSERNDVSDVGVRQIHRSEITASVPISKGCDNFCTYCVVPYTRGKEVQRSFKEIHQEVESSVKRGNKLITLLGQNVNSWKGKLGTEGISFPGLLSKLCDIEGNFWLTFLTSHPKDFGEELINSMANHEKVCKYVNLPIQSGSNQILKAMNRRYSVDDYLMKINMLREKIPEVRLSTDIIVGFPGETEENYEKTLSLIREVKFGMIYVSEYSPRSAAASSKMEDSVPQNVKKKRKMEIEKVEAAIIEKNNNESVGSQIPVLIMNEKQGKTNDLRDIRFEESMEEYVGTFVEAEVTEGTVSGLVGRLAV